MIAYKPDNGDESETVYVCDNCGGISNFSDYWWPGHVHWPELDYTLCNDCLRQMASHGKSAPSLHAGKIGPPH